MLECTNCLIYGHDHGIEALAEFLQVQYLGGQDLIVEKIIQEIYACFSSQYGGDKISIDEFSANTLELLSSNCAADFIALYGLEICSWFGQCQSCEDEGK